jgi:3-phenylpropionate/cinnamic acid dioxygenase small subunit
MSITAPATPVSIGHDTERAIRHFLFHEARLADECDYRAWLNLWVTADVRYWVAPREDTNPRYEVSYVYDDRERLEQRVARWESGFAWAQDPPTNTNRIVGNIEVVAADAHLLTAVANVHVSVSRRGSPAIVVAEKVTYRIVEVSNGYRLREKKVVFSAPEAPVGNITFIL